jgi:competence protein ComEC
MRNFWGKYPAIRLLIPFIAGIILHILLPGCWLVASVVFAVCVVVVIAFVLLKKIWLSTGIFFASGIAPLMAVVAIAYLLTFLHTEIYYPHHFSKQIQEGDFVVAMIDQPLVEKQKSLRGILCVQQLVNEKKAIAATGKISVSFLKDSASEKLRYGDVILLKAKFTAIDAPQNPAQFNYREYMSFHNIWHQTFATSGTWRLVASGQGNEFFAAVYKFRERLMNEIRKFVSTPDELGVAAALLLGYNDFITPDVTRAYAASGALHVLSVSGLHVGVVYWVLLKLLFFMNGSRKMRVFQTIICIAAIWLYACLTGLCPSVMRAATMFSMMAAGRAFKQQPDIYNIIGASALLLMIFDPYIMTEVGFKLSYLAVLGIVYLQPLINNWFVFENRIANWVWSISAVSIAAQATTFPLGLLYFHQFPNLFLISNLVVIPIGNILIVSGIAMFAAQIFYPLQWLIGMLFYYCSLLLNWFVFALDNIPYAILEGISINGVEAILIYILLLLLVVVLQQLKARNLYWFLGILLALFLWNGYEYLLQKRQECFTVYAIKGKQAIAVVRGNEVYRNFDEDLLANESSMLFNVKHHWWAMDVQKEFDLKQMKSFAAFDFGYSFVAKGKRILVIENLDKNVLPNTKITADIITLTTSPKIHLHDIKKITDAPLIIADATNKNYLLKRWKTEAQELNLHLHDVMADGAFVTQE